MHAQTTLMWFCSLNQKKKIGLKGQTTEQNKFSSCQEVLTDEDD